MTIKLDLKPTQNSWDLNGQKSPIRFASLGATRLKVWQSRRALVSPDQRQASV
jgi:hypothetical protein